MLGGVDSSGQVSMYKQTWRQRVPGGHGVDIELDKGDHTGGGGVIRHPFLYTCPTTLYNRQGPTQRHQVIHSMVLSFVMTNILYYTPAEKIHAAEFHKNNKRPKILCLIYYVYFQFFLS